MAEVFLQIMGLWRFVGGKALQWIRRVYTPNANTGVDDCCGIPHEMKILSEERASKYFSSVHVRGSIKVIIHQLDRMQLRVSASQQELLSRVVTKVNNDTLEITLNPACVGNRLQSFSRSEVNLYEHAGLVVVGVSAPYIHNVFAEGSAIVDLNELHADGLNVHASGTAHIGVSGQCENLTAELHESAHVNAQYLESANCVCECNDRSSAFIQARAKLTAKASGLSHIRIYGDPSEKKLQQAPCASIVFNG